MSNESYELAEQHLLGVLGESAYRLDDGDIETVGDMENYDCIPLDCRVLGGTWRLVAAIRVGSRVTATYEFNFS